MVQDAQGRTSSILVSSVDLGQGNTPQTEYVAVGLDKSFNHLSNEIPVLFIGDSPRGFSSEGAENLWRDNMMPMESKLHLSRQHYTDSYGSLTLRHQSGPPLRIEACRMEMPTMPETGETNLKDVAEGRFTTLTQKAQESSIGRTAYQALVTPKAVYNNAMTAFLAINTTDFKQVARDQMKNRPPGYDWVMKIGGDGSIPKLETPTTPGVGRGTTARAR